MNRSDVPGTIDASVSGDKYHDMLALAAAFERSGEELRARSRISAEVLTDPDVCDSAQLAPQAFARAEEDIRSATTGTRGLLSRSVELDADALVVRATVHTYRWIDELQDAAYRTLGSIAGRAIGYLAPEVALGGAIVSAGLIETDAMDRDGVAAYLNELAEHNPAFAEHVTTGGGLIDGLQMRSLLTVGVLAGEAGSLAARGGLRAIGAPPFQANAAAALRDAAGALPHTDAPAGELETSTGSLRPRDLGDLVETAVSAGPLRVSRVSADRFVAWLGGPSGPASGPGGRLRLVGGDISGYVRQVRAALHRDTATAEHPHLLLVGIGQGGTAAAEIAASGDERFVVEAVVTAGSPAALVPVLPPQTRMLSLEDRADPVALLGSLMSTDVPNRVTVVFRAEETGPAAYVAGAREADASEHAELRDELDRLRDLGYLNR